MLIFLISLIIMLVSASIMIILYYKDKYDKRHKFKSQYDDWDEKWYSILLTVCNILAGAMILAMGIVFLITNSSVYKENIRDDLELRIEEINNDYELLQSDYNCNNNDYTNIDIAHYNQRVSEFKEEIKSNRRVRNSIWINWFTSSVYEEYTGDEVQFYKKGK